MRVSIAAKSIFIGCLIVWLIACSQDQTTSPDPLPNQASEDGAAAADASLPTPATAPTQTPTPLVQPSVKITSVKPEQPTPPPTVEPTAAPVMQRTLANASSTGAAIEAVRIGLGHFKVVLAADNHPVVSDLHNYFANNPDQLPHDVSLWFVPNINPDRVPDVLNDADTRADNCDINNNSGRAFETPESRALRDFASDAQLTVLFQATPATPYIYLNSCLQFAPTAELGALLGGNDGIDSGPLRSTVGHFIDYFVGEGVAAAGVALPIPTYDFDGQVARLTAVLTGLAGVVSADTRQAGAEVVWLDQNNVGATRYTKGSFHHPIAHEVSAEAGAEFLLDGGRILKRIISMEEPNPWQIILRPGDTVEAALVLEPIDLALQNQALFALDRAGDLYRYDLPTSTWSLARWDRPVRDLSAHYFVAISTAPEDPETVYMLETTYNMIVRVSGETETVWTLPDEYKVDIDARSADELYVLFQDQNSTTGRVRLYRNGVEIGEFRPKINIQQPRQIRAQGDLVYVLDHGGRRLLQLDPVTGNLVKALHFTDRRPISVFYSKNTSFDATEAQLWAKDTTFYINQPTIQQQVPTEFATDARLAHDPDVIFRLNEFAIPVGIPTFTQRDFQMAGAPRHYRLGVHEGYDFYWARGTQVTAAADGVVIRADFDYVDGSAEQFAFWRGQANALGYTPPDAQDFYRGRQVWIDHGDEIVTQYMHLSAIDASIQVGAEVKQGQLIAYVGNSGSPSSLEADENADAHLHFEIRVGDSYLGQFIRPVEARDWIRRILH